MGRTLRLTRWIMTLSGAAILLQAGSCALTSQAQQQLASQFVIPQVSSVLSDLVFFLLDNALVHLTV